MWSRRAVGLAAAALLGCRIDAVFNCERDDQCQLRGQVGACEPSGYCTFPDPACESGSRYDPRAGGTYADTCTTADIIIDAGVDAVDADPNADSDGDGLKDAVDNCIQVMNADQHDEDGDLVGDVCDLCPQLSAVQADADGDTIGDDCDPRPAAAGDRLVRFDGFGTTGSIPAGWSVLSGSAGNWQVNSDALRISILDTAHVLAFDLGTGGTRQTIDVGATLSGQSGSIPYFSAVFDLDAAANDYFLCTMFVSTNAPHGVPEYGVQRWTGSYVFLAMDSTNPPSVPGDYRTVASNVAGNQSCTFSGTTSRTMTGSAPAGGDTRVGIQVRNIQAAIKYLAVYQSP